MKAIVNRSSNITKIFAKTIEDEALRQIEELCNNEAYLNNKIRIMPDVHAGKGCTIGTTIQLTDKVTPNLVGVDIACGMLSANLGEIDINLEELDSFINNNIPSGKNIHAKALYDFSESLEKLYCRSVVDIDLANRSIGSLGGGNHFIEIDIDSGNNKYLVIHSGSRNLGVRVCKYYQDLAVGLLSDNTYDREELIDRYKKEGRQNELSEVLKSLPKKNINKDLAYLEGTPFDMYIHDMKIVQNYACINRGYMANLILDYLGLGKNNDIPFFTTLHNYIDTDSMILRKGAVRAEFGEILIISMNMRDGSLICVGKGNEDWNYSAPHGAGRLMSRTKAKETFSMNEFKLSMDGIASSSICENTIDEAPMVYKPMKEIIECIKPTVDIVKVIKPIYNFKARE